MLSFPFHWAAADLGFLGLQYSSTHVRQGRAGLGSEQVEGLTSTVAFVLMFAASPIKLQQQQAVQLQVGLQA
jgi:hypothetical protein